MYNLSEDRYFKILRNSAMPASIGLLMRERFRATTGAKRFAIPLTTYLRAQRTLLSKVDRILPMSSSELAALVEGFQISPERSTMVHNGMNLLGPVPGVKKEPESVAIVGRIEPRKNSLALARALAKSGHRVRFAGSLNGKHGQYCRDFLAIVDQEPNIEYLGILNASGVSRLLSRSETYLNPSWCEVVSQADMEAVASGCRVATTIYGYADDFTARRIGIIEPRRFILEPENAIRDVLERATTTDVVDLQALTWRNAAAALVAVYSELSEA